ncbi:hypothetical protein [Nannocystis pusilla]|uniref:hypothetical protein n=1 Tax=Nannocystis pusilla TaxID=889268 RepID=UPI003B7BF3C9
MPVLRLRVFMVFLGLLVGCAGDDHDPLDGTGSSTDAVAPTAEPSTGATTTGATTTGATTGASTTAAPTTGEPDDTTGGPADDLSPKVYPADDPRIQYTGRVDFGDPASPTFSAPGVIVCVVFGRPVATT